MHARSLVFISLLVLVPTVATPQQHGSEDHNVGTVDFQVSCDPEVRADFDRAVALLHHMMYVEARAAFERIAERVPGCAMAHWGIGVTLFQPLWPARPGPEALRRGWSAIRQASELEPATDRERQLVAAAAAFYREPEGADWWTRIRRWEEAMQAAYALRPDDMETAAFYALSQLAVGPVSENRMERQERAAEVLLGIFEREPTHPGAIHYTIHANDVQGRAGESLGIVRSYDDIAPSVPHALHMPTHIFVRLGEWEEVIEWNRKSADAALRFFVGDAHTLHYSHALGYLVYAHLQRGDDEAALAVAQEGKSPQPHQDDFVSAFHLAAMPARHAVERRAWEQAADLTPRTPEYLAWDRYWWPEAMSWFAKGLGAARSGDTDAAKGAEQRIRELARLAEEAGERDFHRYIEIDRLVLSGWLSHAEGNVENAVKQMREAAELEATVQKHPVTPGALYPPYEALGDLLSELNRPAEALAAYQSSLEMWPKRYRSLVGAARGARQAGEGDKARTYYGELLEVIGDAKTDRPAVDEATAYLAERG
jgi:tetratricopeptide (TPR) repeat protein